MKDPNKIIARRQYSCPRKYQEAWHTLLQQHLDAGRIRPSSSQYALLAFIIPKADLKVLPQWVNDYRELNANTIPDNHPLPHVDDILANCAKGKIWAKIDMMNAFFQTHVHLDDVHLTAVTTPFGLYEWLVMPMGCRNALATHQRRMCAALRPFIGKICHVYLDDIIIWSSSVAEHLRNVEKILQALREHSLFCSPKKTDLFCTSLQFLGHIILAKGIEADPSMVEAVTKWPIPRTATEVRSFLGLVRFMASFIPNLAEHTAILTPLMSKEAEKNFPKWSAAEQQAFEAIKTIVLSKQCLTTIDHENPGDREIYVTCNASERGTGAVLVFGTSWETARPVTFDSMQLSVCQRNYPVHKKELLAIVRALTKWRVDLLGTKFKIYLDHKTLEYFMTQKDLSRQQARWQEFLAQYEFEIKYVRGEDNTVADALSCVVMPSACTVIALIFSITTDTQLLEEIKEGYKRDEWCVRLRENMQSSPEASEKQGLLYWKSQLIIPCHGSIRESLYRLAHDTLGHFGADKSYGALHKSFYWPHM